MSRRHGKSRPGKSHSVVLGRKGGSFQQGNTRRDGTPVPTRSEREPRREDWGYRNREDRRDDRRPPHGAPDEALSVTVLGQLSRMPQASTAYQLAQEMGCESRDISPVLRRLVDQGKVLETRPGRYQVSGTGGEFSATVESEANELRARLPDGTVRTINPRYALNAKVGDVVQVMFGEDDLALVTRVLRRSGREVVGTIQFKPSGPHLVCDNRREGLLKVVDKFPGFDDQYRVGNRYVGVLEMDSQGEAGVRLVRLLGKNIPEVADFQYVTLAHDLPGDFPAPVVAQAEAYAKKFVLGKREDLRETLVFTIDPATAKDFDDAISLTKDDQGRWVLGVHIADVSNYVTEGTPLDAEAAGRGTSIYLINRVIPMLPEVLSNGLCSLVPNQPRYCLSAFLTIDRKGNLVGTRLGETLIESRHRFTYEEAMDVLMERDPKGKWPADVRSVVKEVGSIAQLLRGNREKAGALNLFSVEHRFTLDVNGIPVEIKGETSDASHQLIEECMLLANRAVAEWLEQKGLPCVYRLHGEPDSDRLAQFGSVLEVYGIDSSRIQNRFGLQRLLQDLSKEPPASRRVLNYLCLRAFQKATYGIEQHGHYALAFKSYAHFTSPIRRYPDLLVHRLVKRALGLPNYKNAEIRRAYLDALAKQSSFLEQRAEQSERDLHARKAARYLAARIGDSFPAVVVSAFPGGLSIQLLETGMDGMLPMRELRDDFYTFDPKRLCLVGKRSARMIGCGAELDVVVNHVDIERADIVFGIAHSNGEAKPIRPAKPSARAALMSRPDAKKTPDDDIEADDDIDHAGLAAALEKANQPGSRRTTKRLNATSPSIGTGTSTGTAAKPKAESGKIGTRNPAKPAPERDDEEAELAPAPAKPSTRPVTRKQPPVDHSIDRRRVPDRWRTDRIAKDTPRSTKPDPKAGRLGKSNKKGKR